MNTGMEQLRERMCGFLTEQGVHAVTAWPAGERKGVERPVTVVSLRACRGEDAGFQNYLGERYNEETGLWEEVYGRKATLTFGLDLYAPARGEDSDLQAAWENVAAALSRGEPEEMHLISFSCGETEYDSAARLRKRKGEAVCQVWLYALARDGVLFTDFILRGGWNT